MFVVWLEIKLGRRWVNAYIFTLFCHVQSAWADDIVHATGLVREVEAGPPLVIIVNVIFYKLCEYAFRIIYAIIF